MTRWRLPWFWRGTPCRQRSRGDSEPATKLEGTPSRHLVHQNHPNVAHFCRCINRPLAPMPFGYSVRGQCRMERRRARWLCNPKGIVSSSPGLPSPRGYPGLASVRFSTPTGLCPICAIGPQPRWGWPTPPAFPRGASRELPWASGWNPFGIHLWNFRKALGVNHREVVFCWCWLWLLLFGILFPKPAVFGMHDTTTWNRIKHNAKVSCICQSRAA